MAIWGGYTLAALVSGLASLVMQVIGVSTDYWSVQKDFHAGLWTCSGTVKACAGFFEKDRTVARVLEVLGLALSVFALLLFASKAFARQLAANRCFRCAAVLMFFMAGVLGGAGLIFVCEVQQSCTLSSGWSVIVTAIGCFLHTILTTPLAAKASSTPRGELQYHLQQSGYLPLP